MYDSNGFWRHLMVFAHVGDVCCICYTCCVSILRNDSAINVIHVRHQFTSWIYSKMLTTYVCCLVCVNEFFLFWFERRRRHTCKWQYGNSETACKGEIAVKYRFVLQNNKIHRRYENIHKLCESLMREKQTYRVSF